MCFYFAVQQSWDSAVLFLLLCRMLLLTFKYSSLPCIIFIHIKAKTVNKDVIPTALLIFLLAVGGNPDSCKQKLLRASTALSYGPKPRAVLACKAACHKAEVQDGSVFHLNACSNYVKLLQWN